MPSTCSSLLVLIFDEQFQDKLKLATTSAPNLASSLHSPLQSCAGIGSVRSGLHPVQERLDRELGRLRGLDHPHDPGQHRGIAYGGGANGQAALAVEEIDYAAIRVADKTYGYCERCFQPIPTPRLRALPYARLCVACKSGGLSRR